jgi:hypothetical protein
MIQRRLAEHLKQQNWTAIIIEFLLLMRAHPPNTPRIRTEARLRDAVGSVRPSGFAPHSRQRRLPL